MKRILLVALIMAVLVTPAFAQNPVTIGEPVDGKLANTMDTYSLDVEAGQAFFISMNSDDMDTYLEILDADGISIDTDDDSGPGSNSQLLFVAAESGTYSVIARAYSGVGNGTYTLLVEAPSVNPLEVGAEVEVALGGENPASSLFVMELAEPLSLTIMANSDRELDTNLRILDSSGEEVAFSEDFDGIDPNVNRFDFAAGTYYVVLSLYNTEADGSTLLSAVIEESIGIGIEPLVYTVNSSGREVFSVDIVEGTTYELKVVPAFPASGNFTFQQDDSYTNLSYSNAAGVAMLYLAESTGVVRVEMSDYSFSMTATGPQEYTLTFIPVE